MHPNSKEGASPISRKDIHSGQIEHHVERISREIRDGFQFLRKFPKSVSIFGSSMAEPKSAGYENASKLAERIIRELEYAVITGGGPGIMEAANEGAFRAGGPSAGLLISLPHMHANNAFRTDSIKFSYFFTRKTMLTFAAEAYVFFPGGFGTFDELFSILTLVQTGKIPRVPIILFDTHFWSGLTDFFQKKMLHEYGTVTVQDLKLFTITDSFDEIIDIVKKAPINQWWRNIN